MEPEEDISLEGWTSCTEFTKWTSQVCECPRFSVGGSGLICVLVDASAPFKAVAKANADFLTSITPLLGQRNVTLENMYNVFDYMNVNYIHNAAFRSSVTSQQMVSPYCSLISRPSQVADRARVGASQGIGGLP